jgi:hypothetical protein
MNRTVLTCILVTVFVLFSATAHSADTAYDGIYWQQCTPDVKHLFVDGVMGGIMVGQDRVVGHALLNKGSSAVSPECQKAVISVVNSLERQIEQWDRSRFVEALDDFYEEPDNLGLTVKWAVLVVLLEMRGAPEDEIKAYIQQLQRNPQ